MDKSYAEWTNLTSGKEIECVDDEPLLLCNRWWAESRSANCCSSPTPLAWTTGRDCRHPWGRIEVCVRAVILQQSGEVPDCCSKQAACARERRRHRPTANKTEAPQPNRSAVEGSGIVTSSK